MVKYQKYEKKVVASACGEYQEYSTIGCLVRCRQALGNNCMAFEFHSNGRQCRISDSKDLEDAASSSTQSFVMSCNGHKNDDMYGILERYRGWLFQCSYEMCQGMSCK